MDHKTKNIIFSAISLISFYFFNRLLFVIRMYTSKKLTVSFFGNISFNSNDLLIAFISAVGVFFAIYSFTKKNKKTRKGLEYGSARWGTKKDIIPFIDPVFKNNILLTETERITLSNRAVKGQPHSTERNNNVCVIGGSGAGKTRFFLKPNLMQLNCSYIVTDPKFTVINELGKLFLNSGYNVLSFNTKETGKSLKYNPFKYIKTELNVLSFVNVLIANTKGEGEQATEDFWVKSEKLLYASLGWFLIKHEKEKPHNFSTFLDYLSKCDAKEDDENFISEMDKIMQETAKTYPNDFAVKQYGEFKKAAGKTAKSILISCSARLMPLHIEEVQKLTEKNEIDFSLFGTHKTILFCGCSDTDPTLNFLIAIMYTQLLDFLISFADLKHKGKLPIHVRFMLDEFANIGQIPEFEKIISVIRSRNVSASIILQTVSQLTALYKDNSQTILGNCDSLLFLGGKEPETLKMLSELLGKETIDITSESTSYGGQQANHSQSSQKIARELMTPDEIGRLDRSLSILHLAGCYPFKSKKFDITKHENYPLIADDTKSPLWYDFDPATWRLDRAMKKPDLNRIIEHLKESDEELPADFNLLDNEIDIIEVEKTRLEKTMDEIHGDNLIKNKSLNKIMFEVVTEHN